MSRKKAKNKIRVPQDRSPVVEYEDESWAVAGTYVYTSKGLFPISVLKAAERKKQRAESKQLKEEQVYLEQNDLVPFPFEAPKLLDLKDNCSYFDACVKQIAKDVIGQGWKLELKEEKKESNQERERILEFIETSGVDRDETFEQTLERGLMDWGMIGWWAWEVSRIDEGNDKGLINGLWHVPAQTLRIHKGHNKYCQIRNDKKVWFKRFGLEEDIDAKTGDLIGEEKDQDEKEKGEKIDRANELIYYRNYYPQSDYYGAPNILSSISAIIGLIGVRDYNLAFFENYGIPAALIILRGRWSKDTAKQLSDFIDVELKASENAHKTFIVHPHKDSEFEYIKLGIEVKEGSFKLYQKSLRDEILVEYKMPPYRIGIAEVGSLGGTTAVESTKIYAQSVIAPLEQTVERLVTDKLFKEGLKCESYRFELNELDLRDLDAEAKRDQLYFGMGALTSNQILTRQGKKLYPEGNQYFVSSAYLPIGEEPMEKQKLFETMEKMMDENPDLRKQLQTLFKEYIIPARKDMKK